MGIEYSNIKKKKRIFQHFNVLVLQPPQGLMFEHFNTRGVSYLAVAYSNNVEF